MARINTKDKYRYYMPLLQISDNAIDISKEKNANIPLSQTYFLEL